MSNYRRISFIISITCLMSCSFSFFSYEYELGKLEFAGDNYFSKKPLKVFPSSKLPPISEPYLFYWEFGSLPTKRIVANAVGERFLDDAENVLPVVWRYGPQKPNITSESDFFEYYSVLDATTKAFFVDEWQDVDYFANEEHPLNWKNPFAIHGAIQGLINSNSLYPETIILVAWRGERTIAPLIHQEIIDFLVIEAYTNVRNSFPLDASINKIGIEHRIELARNLGYIHNTIPMLGHILSDDEYHVGNILDEDELELLIKFVREIAPEMPGIAFFSSSGETLANQAEALCFKYFVEPAPIIVLTETSLVYEVDKSIQLDISYLGFAKDSREIIEYKVFVDNYLFYQGDDTSFNLSIFTGYFEQFSEAGVQITVHAADSDWNRTATTSFVNLSH